MLHKKEYKFWIALNDLDIRSESPILAKFSPTLPEPGGRRTSREGCWERTGITRSSSFEREGSGAQRLGVPRINERRSRSAEPRKIKPLDINKPVIRHLKQQFMVSRAKGKGTGYQKEAKL